jgi:transcriptional regulator with XRE-family HTH domain
MTLVGTMPRRQLARRLRQLRDHSGLTLHEVATRLEISTSTLSRLENAQVLVDIHLLKDMLDLYGLTIDRWDPYLSLCRQARGRGWWRDYGMDDRGYVALEASANLVREFAVMSIPGLLQTEAYARALFDNAVLPLPKVQRVRQVQVRMLRQRRLYTEDDPLELVAVVDEAALQRQVGGPAVLRLLAPL